MLHERLAMEPRTKTRIDSLPMRKGADLDRGERLFRRLASRYVADPSVTQGTGFGSRPGLRLGTKVFAMLGGDGELVVKLPKERVDALVASGAGARFDPRRDGRLMKEWVTVPASRGRQWGRLVGEAFEFVGAGATKGGAGRARRRA
jgi:hypothetical protein